MLHVSQGHTASVVESVGQAARLASLAIHASFSMRIIPSVYQERLLFLLRRQNQRQLQHHM